ncbi:hypothetical protein F5Y16DRAFT_256937 [Xylariaceae sp. FL0255]|nr:hypothetical protein F5Y16DRAFT_256937 [Xylariaceae sp. FL0255]
MLEPSDELLVQRKERLSCAQDIQGIQESCIREHGKAHTIECAECWTRLLNRMRDRYLLSADKEWFSGRRAFLQELDSLFAQACRHEVDIKAIEQRIVDEKREWYRDKVKIIGLQAITKTQTRAVQQKINDRTISIEQLATDLRECLGENANLHEGEFSTFLEQLKAAQSPSAKADAYIDILYRPGRDPVATAKSQKYIDMIADGKPVAEVIALMNRDRQSTKGDMDQKQRLQKKLEELRRAKAAHELAKAKSHQTRQDKVAQAAAQTQQRTLGLPSCANCRGFVDQQRFKSCKLCLVLAEKFKVLDEPVVYCSKKCFDEGYYSHESTHHCRSDGDCTSLLDSDVEMDGSEGSGVVFCRECVQNLKKPSVFCGARCFHANFQQHRDRVHEGHEDQKAEHIALHDAFTEWVQEKGAIENSQ